jgi:hypothetical protein
MLDLGVTVGAEEDALRDLFPRSRQ